MIIKNDFSKNMKCETINQNYNSAANIEHVLPAIKRGMVILYLWRNNEVIIRWNKSVNANI